MLKELLTVLLISIAFIGGGQDLEKIDSLENELTTKNDSLNYEIYFKIFVEFVGTNHLKALEYADKSLQVALHYGDSLLITKSYHARGDMKLELGNGLDAIVDMETALSIARRNGYQDRIKFLLNNLALAYTRVADYDTALDYHFKSLEMREKDQDSVGISISYNNIGLVYLDLTDFENALSYFRRSYDLAKKINYTYQIEARPTNIGFCYAGLGDFEKAIESFREAEIECQNNNCNNSALVTIHDAIGSGLLNIDQLNGAESEFIKSIQLAREIKLGLYECSGLRGLAKVNLKKSRIKEALEFLDKAQLIATETDLKTELLENYNVYSSIYAAANDYKKSSEYQKKYIALNKSIFNGELIKNISRITTAYEERENIKTIAAKDQVLLLQKEVIARQRSQYIFIITITFLVMGLAFVMYRANQSQRKANQALAIAKETIQQQNRMLSVANHKLEEQVEERTKELFESNESLSKVNDELDNFIYKTSHDIRGPLASLKGMCNVAMLDVKDELALDYLMKLDTSAAKLNSILSRLLIINQINHSILTPEYINFKEKIEEILDFEKKKGMPSRMAISYEIEPELKFRSDKEMVKIILENLIDNAIKFHNESERVSPFVNIRVFNDKEWVTVKVIDNGIGIREISKEKIFQLFVRASERSDTGGIGLYLSKLATTKLDGTIGWEINAEGFTEFTVQFPPDLVPIIEKRREDQIRREKEKQKVLKST